MEHVPIYKLNSLKLLAPKYFMAGLELGQTSHELEMKSTFIERKKSLTRMNVTKCNINIQTRFVLILVHVTFSAECVLSAGLSPE